MAETEKVERSIKRTEPKIKKVFGSADGKKKVVKAKLAEKNRVGTESAAAESSDSADGDAVDPPTPLGEKKRLSPVLAKSYDPQAVEATWYEWWERSGFFKPELESRKPPFVIVVPPPNVTGALHIGHALTAAVEDAIVRWRRMSGFNTLWVPGVDHAGIATQVVVEKMLKRERGLTRHDMGREKFVAEVWKWKEAYGGTICQQQRRIGASLDWSRECFTMDPQRVAAVIEAFVQLHKEGLIYRDNRLVNWDCILRTAISDIEVDYVELKGRTPRRVPGYSEPVEFGVLISFAYPLEDESGEIVVATTRVETMLGDTAVAIHPEDQRYLSLHGKFVVHPFSGKKLPIICDSELVDMSFGTGAVKITPAHDPNDFETGKRHNLEFINIFTDDGKINSNGGKDFQGLKRFDARVAVVKALEDKGLYRGLADNPMRLGVCSRSDDVVEPMIKPQWYVSCRDMAKEACDVVRNGQLEIIPKQFADTWFRWLENTRDWCISRQLWWGHRIPAWYVTLEDDPQTEFGTYSDHWVVGRDKMEASSLATIMFPGKKFQLDQDPDVLDTWFSSGLFPFSVMGWPENTADLKTFYPTTLLETGHDILFFWVARMVMLGLKLTGQLPFRQIFLHAMVRDAHGRKMSKSTGNVIDPLEVINGVTLENLHKKLDHGNLDPREVEKAKHGQVLDFPSGIPQCGADALRFSLIAYTAQAQNVNLDIQRVVGYRFWCNKLWNVIRFAMMNLGCDFVASQTLDISTLPFSCQWILSVLNNAIQKTVNSFKVFDLSEASTAVYSWWLYELCDVFIEIIKPSLRGSDDVPEVAVVKKAIRNTLWVCLDTGLRLLHPFMPFITEELWQRLPHREGDVDVKSSIMLSDYPSVTMEWENNLVESQMKVIESAVKATRSLRMTYSLQPKQRAELFLHCRDDEIVEVLKMGAEIICTLATLSSVKVLTEADPPPVGCAVGIVSESLSAYLLLSGLVDANTELSKLKKKKEEIMRNQELLSKKVGIPEYIDKVPINIREANSIKAARLSAELESVLEAVSNFENLRLE